ncbi:MAG TPA: hypothetical protein VFV10_08720 [Gammaproteobacteria bacterium]|nr:hypothetical protein [Gammaproteobacteria bacterium]
MTKCIRCSIAALTAAVLTYGPTPASAGDSHALPDRLGGLLNDYSPDTVKGGPYEMRGAWSLDLHGLSGKAGFSAVMNMETSDWGISIGQVRPDDPSSRGAHTHHITMADAEVTLDTSVCPALAPATSGGFVVTGTVHVTGNGSPAPFDSSSSPPTTAQICITGGTTVQLSNFTLTFSGPATGHFGTQAIHGVVTCTWPTREDTNGLCDEDKFRSSDGHESHGNGGWFDDDRFHSNDHGDHGGGHAH